MQDITEQYHITVSVTDHAEDHTKTGSRMLVLELRSDPDEEPEMVYDLGTVEENCGEPDVTGMSIRVIEASGRVHGVIWFPNLKHNDRGFPETGRLVVVGNEKGNAEKYLSTVVNQFLRYVLPPGGLCPEVSIFIDTTTEETEIKIGWTAAKLDGPYPVTTLFIEAATGALSVDVNI